MTQTEITDVVAKIEAAPAGKSLSIRRDTRYVQVSRRDGRLVVETGWTVPEQMDSDWQTSMYWPFAPAAPRSPWSGRQLIAVDVQSAAAAYAGWREDLRVGSVARMIPGAVRIGTEA